MGADGNIAIYDYDKIVAQWGKARTKELTSSMWNSYLEEPLFPGSPRLWHLYWGDNVDVYPGERREWLCGSEEERARCDEVYRWAQAHAQLAEWEVWT